MRAASGGHDPIVELLLASGAPWNALDRRRMCAGDYAMGNEHEDTVQILLSAGELGGAGAGDRGREIGDGGCEVGGWSW